MSRTIAEIRQDLNAKTNEVRGIDVKNEEAYKNGLAELDNLMNELRAANKVEEAEQLMAEKKLDNLQKQAGRSFSFVKFIRESAEGRGLTDIEAEVAAMGADEFRRLGLSAQGNVVPSAFLRSATGQNYGTAADGGNLIEQMSARYVDDLKKKLVVAQLGATVLTDLVGTLPVITSAQIAASWEAEGAFTSATKAAYAKATMTPHRNMIQVAVTKDLLRQTSFDVEANLVEKITDAHANLIEAAAIAGTGSNNQPTGILNTSGIGSVAMGTNGGNITWAKVVALESEINGENANRGSLAYLTNSKVWGNFKTIQKAANTARFILDDAGLVNGYKADWSNFVPADLTKGTSSACSAIIFGDWSMLYIGQWGGLDIVTDPFSRAAYGEVLITLNAYNDVLVAQPKSFAAIQDVTIA